MREFWRFMVIDSWMKMVLVIIAVLVIMMTGRHSIGGLCRCLGQCRRVWAHRGIAVYLSTGMDMFETLKRMRVIR